MEVAAERSGLSRATISRIESAKQTILPRTVRLLCQTYGVGVPLIDHLTKLAAESDDRGWHLAYSDTVPNWFERFVGEEAEATEISTYEAEFVPGLLQTADYWWGHLRCEQPRRRQGGSRPASRLPAGQTSFRYCP